MHSFNVALSQETAWLKGKIVVTDNKSLAFVGDGMIEKFENDYLYYMSQEEERYVYVFEGENVRLLAFKSRDKVAQFVAVLADHTYTNDAAPQVPSLPESLC